MEQVTVSGLFGGYCYGPADLSDIELGDGYMRLLLRDASGRKLSAVYRGCAYWPITQSALGRHFTVVEEVSLPRLAQTEYANVRYGLRTGSASPMELLEKWQAEGYHFYLHGTNERDADYLVVAREVRVNA